MPDEKKITTETRHKNPWEDYLPQQEIVYVEPTEHLPKSNTEKIGQAVSPLLQMFIEQFIKAPLLDVEVNHIEPRANPSEADLPLNLPVLDLAPLESYWFCLRGKLFGFVKVTIIVRIY